MPKRAKDDRQHKRSAAVGVPTAATVYRGANQRPDAHRQYWEDQHCLRPAMAGEPVPSYAREHHWRADRHACRSRSRDVNAKDEHQDGMIKALTGFQAAGSLRRSVSSVPGYCIVAQGRGRPAAAELRCRRIVEAGLRGGMIPARFETYCTAVGWLNALIPVCSLAISLPSTA